ncbi:MAG TPA: NPCBM/NEW2 domain-containing protein, partial [Chloroflexota bacterium]|nr:NPCBM/NEW2 domain-containing protein [Chloroflexota bacterium]
MIQPERDVSFSRNPIVLVGQAYDKGLGTFPPSTISYSLEGRYSAFSATAGINDDAPRDAAAVFQVYADGVLVHTTGPVAAHASPATIDLCTAGVQQLDLVVAAAGERGAGRVGFPADAAGAVAVWAGARLFEPAAVDPSAAAAVREQIGRVVEGHHTRAIGEL